MNTRCRCLIIIAGAIMLLASTETFGQARWLGGDGNWNDPNWTGGTGPGGAPAAGNTISFTSNAGNVEVTTDLINNVGVFGSMTLQGGALTIAPTGTIQATGDQRVNNVLQITGEFRSDGGLDVLREGAGVGVVSIAGDAVVRVDANLDTWWDNGAELSITGPSADIEVGATFFLGTAATMTANINSNSFSTVYVLGNVNFAGGNGTLDVNFIDGYEPELGTSWVLFDTPSRGGTIPIVNVPDVGAGKLLHVNYGEGGEWGQVVTLDFRNTLNLKVNTESGLATIENPASGGEPLDIDGYIIRSPSGALVSNQLTGLGAGWLPGLPPSQSSTLLSETNFDGSSSMATGSSMPLGDIFSLGGSQDLQFEFHLAGGRTLPGTVQYVQGVRGDFNGDGVLDASDINDLTAKSAANSTDLTYDLTGDGIVNGDDVNEWISAPDIFNSYLGDANLDLEFNSGDLVSVLSAGKYETNESAVWEEGDFTGDGLADTGDLVAALAGGGYEQGPKAAVAAVPEPSTVLGLASGLLMLVVRRRR